MTEFLTLEDLVTLTRDLDVGPIRDVGLLESAAHRPRTSAWGQEAYPDLEMKAAVLLESLVRHHPLVDGNKRLGWVSAVVFLEVNGRWLEADDDEAYEIVIGVADGSISAEAVGQAFRRWCGDG